MTLLTKRMVEKPWGKDVLPAPFVAPVGQRIGEVWFEPPSPVPSILVKYIFTSEKLSVQVHPSDAQAAALGETDGGKDECWLVIDAEPGATLGVGFKEPLNADAMRIAALDGSIEDLIEWYPVKRGDFFYIPAGTVHAIGAGISLIEVQQASDITYRLFDYGRPRELHLDAGLSVASGLPHNPAFRRALSLDETVELARQTYFVAHFVKGLPSPEIVAEYDRRCLVLPLAGRITDGRVDWLAGDCGWVETIRAVTFDPAGDCVLVHPA